MDRITVQPTEVRGLGDILSPKSTTDFEEYLGTLSSGTDTVNGASMTVYTLAYASNVASVSLTSNKSILSYADSESATLSATVLDSDSEPVEGVSVEFFNGATSLGTADTNSSGVATKTYASAGAGDLSFTAKVGSLVSETYSIEDCIWYNPLTSSTDKITWDSSATVSYSSDGVTYKTSSDKANPCTFTVPQNASIEGSVKFSASGGQMPTLHNFWGYKVSASQVAIVDLEDSSAWNNKTTASFSTSTNTWYTYKITCEGTTAKLYINDGLKVTKTLLSQSVYRVNFQSSSSNVTVKNIKVKPL